MKKLLTALAIILGVTILVSPLAIATPEYSKKEDKQCVYCHTAMGKPDLNEAGRWYKEHDHTFKGWVDNKEKKKP